MPLAPASAACRARPVAIGTLKPTPAMTGTAPRTSSTVVAHDRKMLGGGQRIELAGASGGDDRGRRMPQHRAEIPAQAVEVERQVSLERRNGKPDHALQLRPQITW